MNTLHNDLISMACNGEVDILVHGCNCFNTMGAGIAKFVKENFPEAYQEDCKTTKGDQSKLGGYTWVNIPRIHPNFIIINAYTQYNYGKASQKNIDYDALSNVFSGLNQQFAGRNLFFPKIGAGLAGGDWHRIENIIEQSAPACSHTLVIKD
jgi:O-acetyl-ADP-ribose deacetylase (regulator of RNase III)